MRRGLPILVLAALAACDSPAGPDETRPTTDTTAVTLDEPTLHISESRGKKAPYGGEVLTPGPYWLRVDTDERDGRGRGQSSRSSWGVDSVVFIVDGARTSEVHPPYETKVKDWKVGEHTVDWSVFGAGAASDKVTVQVAEDGGDDPVGEDPPSDAPDGDDPSSNDPPAASFAADCTDLTCALNASASDDEDGSLVSYAWKLGDGTTAAGEIVEHTYDSAGSYEVVLTVRDDDGAQTQASETVDVQEAGSGSGSDYDVAIEPGQSIQNAVNANPEGTVFLIRAGTHSGQRVTPRSGQTFMGEGAGATILDGNGATCAFCGSSGADDVTIRNLTITDYGPATQFGAIEPEWQQGTGWIVEDCEIAQNAAVGVKVSSGMVIRRNHIHHNGQLGIAGTTGTNLLIEDNEISYNNTDGHDPLWEAGGMKILKFVGTTVRGNHVHDNAGIGVWFDHDNSETLIEGNRIERNLAGIHLEIGGSALVRGNTILNNGDGSTDRFSRAGILVYSSSGVEVTGNTLSGNDQGIIGLSDNRVGVYRTENLWVHDNDVTQQRGGTGLQDWAGDGQVYSANNRFDRNTYYISGNARPFWYRGEKTETEWQSKGQDPNGTFIR